MCTPYGSALGGCGCHFGQRLPLLLQRLSLFYVLCTFRRIGSAETLRVPGSTDVDRAGHVGIKSKRVCGFEGDSRVIAGHSGLIVTTLDGGLHAFDINGNPTWRSTLGAPLIEVSSSSSFYSGDSLTSRSPSASRPWDDSESPMLLPALDGTLFFAEGGVAEYINASMRQVVDASPTSFLAAADMYLVGDRLSRLHTVKVPYAQDNLHVDNLDGSLVSGTTQLTAMGHKLRFGTTQWNLTAVDVNTDAQRWSITYREIAGLPDSLPVPDKMLKFWRDRVEIGSRTVTLQPRSLQATSADFVVGNMEECAHEQDEDAITLLGAPALARTYGFDSEVIGAYVFSEPRKTRRSSTSSAMLGLKPVARASPQLPAFLERCVQVSAVNPPPLAPHLPRHRPNLLQAFVSGAATPLARSGVALLSAPDPLSQAVSSQSCDSKEPPIALGRIYSPIFAVLAFCCFGRCLQLLRRRWLRRLQRSLNTTLCSDWFDNELVEVSEVKSASAAEMRACEAALTSLPTSPASPACSEASPSSPTSSSPSPAASPDMPAFPPPASIPDPLGTSTSEVAESVSMLPAQALDAALVPPDTKLGQSLRNGHFSATFSDAALIGVGGFGAVYRAKHRLEGGWYAVKFVSIEGLEHSDAVNERRDFLEVANLRRLADSRHVVRYFTCWCEEPQFLSGGLVDNNSRKPEAGGGANCGAGGLVPLARRVPASTQELMSKRFISESNISECSREPYQAFSDDSSAVVFIDEDLPKGSVTRDGCVKLTPSRAAVARPGGVSASCGGKDEVAVVEAVLRQNPRYHAVLMIQMELCTGPTLRCWLDENQARAFHNFKPDSFLGFAFARQLMKGIREIHAAEMVHRDIKPQNLFVTHDRSRPHKGPLLKIGDFGLSRSLLAGLDASESGRIGTPAYCAPESGARAGAPADIFSAAMIVLEMLCPPFSTAMERARAFEACCQGGSLPHRLDEMLPEHSALLRMMAHHEPQRRPTAEQAHTEFKRLGAALLPAMTKSSLRAVGEDGLVHGKSSSA